MADLKDPEETEFIHKLAMKFLPALTADAVREMEQHGFTPSDLFGDNFKEILIHLPGLRRVAGEYSLTKALQKAAEEDLFLKRHGIRFVYLGDDDYPPLLREIPDAPIGLFVLGTADMTGTENLAMVGTRRCTQYGIDFCRNLTSELATILPGVTIVSGLAHGIDTAAHSGAISAGLKTWAVVAHGLDMIYPAANRELASTIIKKGGAIITEYPSGERIFRNNFLQRNRIVAGLCPTTIVVESEVKGGAMSTANTAFSYSREVVAVPGRYTDRASGGCNKLIHDNKATIYESAQRIVSLSGWQPAGTEETESRPLFPELDGPEKIIYELMAKENTEPMTVDRLVQQTGLKAHQLLAALTELEFSGLVSRLPGSRYTLQ